MDANHTWTKDEIKALLANNDRAVEHAVVTIWKRQTAQEQDTHSTHVLNGRGFNGTDAGLLSSFAEQLQRPRYDGSQYHLSAKQMALARRKVAKYAGQLVAVANHTEEV